jgi:hypothetical protein
MSGEPVSNRVFHPPRFLVKLYDLSSSSLLKVYIIVYTLLLLFVKVELYEFSGLEQTFKKIDPFIYN